MTHFFHSHDMSHGAAHGVMAHGISAAALSGQRQRIERLMKNGRKPITRRVATVALIAADESADRLWRESQHSIASLRNIIDSVPPGPDGDPVLRHHAAESAVVAAMLRAAVDLPIHVRRCSVCLRAVIPWQCCVW